MPESMTAPTATAPPSATDLYAPGCDPREAHGCSASPGSCGPTAPICGSKEPSRSRGTSTCTWPLLSVSTAFGRVPFRTLPGPGTSRPCFSCPGARSSPAKRGLQHRLGQLLQQPADSEAALHGGMREGCYRLRARRPRSQYGAADRNCLTRAPRRGGVTTPSCNIEDKSSRVAQCSASFPSSMRNQWLCSLVNRLPLGGKNPLSLPELVPVDLTRTATMSSSATMDSILMLRSGNWPSSHSAVPRIAVGPCTFPGAVAANGAAACSEKSSAMSSSHAAISR